MGRDGTVQIESGKPYTGEAPATIAAPQEQTAPTASSAPDESVNANPAIFTGSYTREAYNALRQTVITGMDSAPVAMSDATWDAMQEAIAAIGVWPAYDLKISNGKAYFTTHYSSNYQAAADYCKTFIDSLSGKNDAEKVKAIACYVCDRLTYDAASVSTPRTVLVSDSVSKGNCMSYAHNFMFLCNMADIPCVFVHSDTHQWNEVFVDGRWWSVDASATDAGNDPSIRPYQTILWDRMNTADADYRQAQPMLTQLAKEVLVPGSTK